MEHVYKTLYEIALKNTEELVIKEFKIYNNFLDHYTISVLPNRVYYKDGEEMSEEEFDKLYQKFRNENKI